MSAGVECTRRFLGSGLGFGFCIRQFFGQICWVLGGFFEAVGAVDDFPGEVEAAFAVTDAGDFGG